MAQLGRCIYPELKTVLSTWMFDTPPEGEWQGLADYMSSDGEWIDYILADAHEDFPRYPLDAGVPPGCATVCSPLPTDCVSVSGPGGHPATLDTPPRGAAPAIGPVGRNTAPLGAAAPQFGPVAYTRPLPAQFRPCTPL